MADGKGGRSGQRAAAAAHIGDGVVYLGLWQPRCLLALDAGTGAELWRKRTSGSFSAAPFTASGVVYGGHRGGVLHGWNARSGREVWRAEVMWDEARQGAPLIAGDRAYVTGSNGKVHALALHCTAERCPAPLRRHRLAEQSVPGRT
ncbi:PQQ-binding-like beta-propeller repeat protein [Streptomyces sp. NPDC093089]|uniref:outer membrane protein assembly factor BamB family protein n=1 Tax=Streptomyces sp. NPDC093089 TaxID=3366024 RepID=UPI003803B219